MKIRLIFLLIAAALPGCKTTYADGSTKEIDREVLHFIGDATRAVASPYVKIPPRVAPKSSK